METLRDNLAIVTAGGSGIRFSIGKALAEEGRRPCRLSLVALECDITPRPLPLLSRAQPDPIHASRNQTV